MKRYGYALLNLSHSLLRFSLFSFLWIYAVSFSAWAQTASTEAQIDEVLTLLDEGSSIENRVIDLRDILFEFDSPDLTPTTRPYLDKVVTLMQRVPNIQVEISGHTDNVGNADYNLGLSGKRADRVRTYLVDAGIASERITAVGLGDTQPLVENTTAVGRAKNRRVEMQIIKPEAVANIQDLIVLISGDTIGGKVLSATEEGVRYRSFLKDEEGFLKPGTVKKVIYASGEVWYAPKPVIPAEPAVVKTKKSWEKPAFLHSVETFEQGTVIVQATYEFASNLADSPLPYKTQSLPAMGLTIDKSVGANVGLGITLAGRWWGDPTLAYNFLYASISGRATYHVNLHPKLDPYVGLTLTHRRVQFWNQDYREQNGVTDINAIIGARYYLLSRMGIVVEAGSDAIAHFRAGLCFRFH